MAQSSEPPTFGRGLETSWFIWNRLEIGESEPKRGSSRNNFLPNLLGREVRKVGAVRVSYFHDYYYLNSCVGIAILMTSTLLLCLFSVLLRSHCSTYQVAKKIEELRPACELYLYAFQTKYEKATRITIGEPYIFASTTNGSELPNLQNSKFQIPGFQDFSWMSFSY